MANVQELEKQIFELTQQLSKARKESEPEEVDESYVFQTEEGDKTLSDLFGDKDELILIHNMGISCAYCSLWADGFISMYPHIKTRAAFVLVNNDSLEIQAETRKNRGWNFPMARDDSRQFTKTMGFADNTHLHPGTSVFIKGEDGKIYRKNKSWFGPGDHFCSVWHFWDLLDGGTKEWHPTGWNPENLK